MPVNTFRISNQEGERQICVIDGQPYYKSTGTNSQMAGVWLPFERFGPPNKRTGMMHKPYSDPELSNPRIEHYFPPTIVEAFIDHYGYDTSWKRFKNMECLYMSCLLTDENNLHLPIAIRNAVKQYIGLNPNQPLLPNFDFHPEQTPVLDLARTQENPLTDMDYQDLTAILDGMRMQSVPTEEREENVTDTIEDIADDVLQDLSYPNIMPEELAIYVNYTRIGGANPIPAITQQLTEQSAAAFHELSPHFEAIRQRQPTQATNKTGFFRNFLSGFRTKNTSRTEEAKAATKNTDTTPPTPDDFI